MIDIVQQIITLKNSQKQNITKNDLVISDTSILEKKWEVFVTFYKSWNILNSAWNIITIETDIVNELLFSSIQALEWIDTKEYLQLQIRIDIIQKREILKSKSILELNPTQVWVIAIKRSNDKLAVILPNISPNITSWAELKKALEIKLQEDIVEENYILYEFTTQQFTSF